MVTNINMPNAQTRAFVIALPVNASASPATPEKAVAVKFAQMTAPATELAST